VLLGSIGLVPAIAGVLIPTRLVPVERAWMTLARAISFVTIPIVMAVLYFGIITPVGLLRRLVADNPIVQRHEQRILEDACKGAFLEHGAAVLRVSDESHQ
jgi:hypothetical protein